MSQSQVLLTPEEAADVLRVSPADVIGLLEEGSLGGMPVAGHWRIRADSIGDFLREGLQRENLRAIERALHDPAHWEKVLREFPNVATIVEHGEYLPNSLGAFLKDALRPSEPNAEDRQAMGTIILHHGTGAQDFEIIGPAWEPSEAKRVLFNARRLLISREQADAVALFDSAPFAVFPATNHFNDDFHVLHAELPLLDYEEVRLAQAEKRQAARQLRAWDT